MFFFGGFDFFAGTLSAKQVKTNQSLRMLAFNSFLDSGFAQAAISLSGFW